MALKKLTLEKTKHWLTIIIAIIIGRFFGFSGVAGVAAGIYSYKIFQDKKIKKEISLALAFISGIVIYLLLLLI